LPPALGQIQFVDYRKQDRNAAFRLARAITTVPLEQRRMRLGPQDVS